jgi:hypothetical protein
MKFRNIGIVKPNKTSYNATHKAWIKDRQLGMVMIFKARVYFQLLTYFPNTHVDV